jgi:VWFA-related protein
MRRIIGIALALALCAAVWLALPQAGLPAPRPTGPGTRVTQVDSSHYPDVTVYVGVADAAGAPVGGLGQRDFTISEDGQPVEVTAFSGGASVVAAALVIDRSGSMAQSDKIDGARDAASAFVGQMRAADRTALIAFNSTSDTLQPFTADQGDLSRAIGRLEPDGGTALYDSIIAGVDALAGAQGRRALLLLADGQDCRDSDVCPDRYGSRHTLEQAIDYATAHAQPVYVIGLGERGSAGQDGIDEAVLSRIARETGGEYFYTPGADQLTALYRKLSADIQQEYALTYRSPRPFYDGTRRDIRVSVGGAAAGGGYVERHLINVHSDPLVGAVLLLPIAGALGVPLLLRRRRRAGSPAAPQPAAYATGPLAAPAALGSTVLQAPSVVVLPPDVARCQSCDAALLRAGARFCAECGASQVAEAAPRRYFCDQCGRPMRAGAQFCASCGATAPQPYLMGQS